MPRTTHDQERMERLDRRDRERERTAYRQHLLLDDEDTLFDLSLEDLEQEAEGSKPGEDPDALKCERVQDRGPARDCEED